MLNSNISQNGFSISNIATCDFNELAHLDNQKVFELAGKNSESNRLAKFIEKTMGITHRYRCQQDNDAMDNAVSALQRLLDKDPSLVERAEFLIFAGISNPRPITTISTLLANRFGLKNVSCWDIKSGCSTGVLALMQGQSWLNMGAKCGIIVSSENLSKFSPPEVMQISAACGDGAAALAMEASDEWVLKSVVHGTNAEYANNIKLPGKFPIDIDSYQAQDYLYQLNEKGDTIEKLQHYWLSSLAQLLDGAQINGSEVNHYIAHQVDGSKNQKIAMAGGIAAESVAKNFKTFGNMGSPTVLINYHQWVNRPQHQFNSGDHLVFHAVGGGISWAGLCLQKR